MFRAGQPRHLGDQGLARRSEAEGNERLDERDGRVDLPYLRVLSQSPESDVFDLAFPLDADYPFHEAAPFCVGCSVSDTNRSTLGELLRFFS